MLKKTQTIKDREVLLETYNQLIQTSTISIGLNIQSIKKLITIHINNKFRRGRRKRRVRIRAAAITGPVSSKSKHIGRPEQRRARLRHWTISERGAIAREKINSNLWLLRLPESNQLYCVFNKSSFRLGGRFYGPPYQAIPKILRKHLLINGGTTVELDYSEIHINICYAKKSLICPQNPYLLDYRCPMRTICKRMLNSALNAKDENKALKATLREICSRSDLYRALMNSTYGGLRPMERLAAIYQELLTLHSKVKCFIASNMGPRLQYADSILAVEVLKHFTERGIIVLPIHDSFIIQEQYKSELLDVMKMVYRRRYGSEISVSSASSGKKVNHG